ncbi:MAG: hypothetical protein JO007_16025 [Alphaproteobacteria bacterium]|nr:hypothetical protein [Alphaproteobacteria bacterium]
MTTFIAWWDYARQRPHLARVPISPQQIVRNRRCSAYEAFDLRHDYDFNLSCNAMATANHIHSVWHGPSRDFGTNLLRRHYERGPHHAAARG